jgi:hypothetical protein
MYIYMSVGLEIYPYAKGKQCFQSRLKLDLYTLMNLQELFLPFCPCEDVSGPRVSCLQSLTA